MWTFVVEIGDGQQVRFYGLAKADSISEATTKVCDLLREFLNQEFHGYHNVRTYRLSTPVAGEINFGEKQAVLFSK